MGIDREALEGEGGAVLRALFADLAPQGAAQAQAELDVRTDTWTILITFTDGYRWSQEFTRPWLAGHDWKTEMGALAKRVTERLAEERTKAEAERPLLIEPVIGFRSWAVGRDDKDQPTLGPIGFGTWAWRGGAEARATCAYHEKDNQAGGCPHEPDTIPDPRCECGFYAYHRPPSGREAERVIGALSARGGIEVYREGFRAEYARPVLLAWGGPEQAPEVKTLAARLGIDAVPLAELESSAKRFGATVPESLWPDDELKLLEVSL